MGHHLYFLVSPHRRNDRTSRRLLLHVYVVCGQSILIFNRAHVNRWWTLTLEILVIPHGVLVAINQAESAWRMFGFGFGAVFIMTQLYGLGLSPRIRTLITSGYVLALLIAYGSVERIGTIHEILRIPILDYAVVAILYFIWLGIAKTISLLNPKPA